MRIPVCGARSSWCAKPMPDSPPDILCGLPPNPHLALELLTQSSTEPERSLQRQSLAEAIGGERRGELVWVRAARGDELQGVALGQKIAGRAAAVYPPQLAEGANESLAPALLRALDEELSQGGVRLAQALLHGDQVEAKERLVAGGYQTAATLLYMVCERGSFPSAGPKSDVELSLLTAADEPQLHAVIEATYDGTLDCPLLNGLRSTADVVASYRAVGDYRPDLWRLVRRRGEVVGCLILADHPELSNLELIYLGVIPSARGSGLGLLLTQAALWTARELGRQRVVLAVDAANTPAIALYEAAGFMGFDQRQVLIKAL